MVSGGMTKRPISLQDLRRSLYVKTKAEPSWCFCVLYVHVCRAVTNHSSQGKTADRVLIHADTELWAKDLLNNRKAYVAVSRGVHDAQWAPSLGCWTQGWVTCPFMLSCFNKDADCRLMLRFYRELESSIAWDERIPNRLFLQYITDNHPFFVRYKNDDIVNFL